MIDPEIKTNVDNIKMYIKEINILIAELYDKGVDVQLIFDNNKNGKGSEYPTLELWRAIAKVDYL